MSQNKIMHEKSPFKDQYDFSEMIKVYPALKSYVFENKYGTSTIDFGNNNAVKSLNAGLLKFHYDLDWDIPAGHLCPPIPGRLDYLLHLSELSLGEEVKLLDIGTGVSFIYPLLAQKHFNWEVVGSDISEEAIKSSNDLLAKNSGVKGEVRLQSNKAHYFHGIIKDGESFDVVVCNPPFYKSEAESKAQNIRKIKGLKKGKVAQMNFGGTANELWCEGGELAFIVGMIQESEQYKNKVNWFTCMVSNQDHLRPLKRQIAKVGAEVKIVSMGQGNKKSRFIAWKF